MQIGIEQHDQQTERADLEEKEFERSEPVQNALDSTAQQKKHAEQEHVQKQNGDQRNTSTEEQEEMAAERRNTALAEEQRDDDVDKPATEKDEEDLALDLEYAAVRAYTAKRKPLRDLAHGLYYVYHDGQIIGPYDAQEILKLFVTAKIKTECWMRCVKFSYEPESEWCRVNLSPSKGTDNLELKEMYPDLFETLALALSDGASAQCEPPHKPPMKALKKLTAMRKMLMLLGRIAAVLALMLVVAHALPTICLAFCCFLAPYSCGCRTKDNDYDSLRKYYDARNAFFFFSYWAIPVTPFVVVYVVLLDIVDDPQWNGEIQSWMIAYLSWGALCFVLLTAVFLGVAVSHELAPRFGRGVLTATFWVLGLHFGDMDVIEILDATRDSDDILRFVMATIFVMGVFPAMAALLPASVVGFIANYVLEEKFELECTHQVEDQTLCYQDYGCCQVISSHDVRNSYAFMGGLASNILATWAVLRITGYLMVNALPQITVFARRQIY